MSAREDQVAKRTLASAISASKKAEHTVELTSKKAVHQKEMETKAREQAEAADIIAAGSAAAALAKNEVK